jgi:hypothetical protein
VQRSRCSPQATRRQGPQTAPAPGKASTQGPSGWRWASGALAVSQSARACKVTRSWATRACTSRAWWDDAVIGRQGDGTLERLDTGSKNLSSADVMGLVAGLPGSAPREWRGFESGPEAEAVPQEHHLFGRQPREDVREGVLERPGQARRQPDVGADEAPTVCDEVCPGTHPCAWRGEGRALGAGFEAECNLACGILRGILGSAGGKRFAGRGHGERMDGQEHDKIL